MIKSKFALVFALVMLFFALPMSAKEYKEYADLSNRYKWVGVFVGESGKVEQILKSHFHFYEFQDTIKRLWNSGYVLDDIKYGDGKWVGVFSKNTKGVTQKYYEAGRWNDMDGVIEKEWKDGNFVTKVEYGLGKWIAFFANAQSTGYTHQGYERREELEEFRLAIRERWRKGFTLTHVEYGEGRWLGIFSKGKNLYKDQAFNVRSYWPDTVMGIEDRWRENQKITSIANGLHRWFVLFSKSTQYGKQGYEASSSVENFEIKLKERNAKGYRLIHLSEGW
ncbi:MAG: hypothetical protein KU38_01760 [Sulfurovum sp. FS08-3]|nr:MAG: hypothetical protein KU38_01760 [Sulfurovum sp. FS08-3]